MRGSKYFHKTWSVLMKGEMSRHLITTYYSSRANVECNPTLWNFLPILPTKLNFGWRREDFSRIMLKPKLIIAMTLLRREKKINFMKRLVSKQAKLSVLFVFLTISCLLFLCPFSKELLWKKLKIYSIIVMLMSEAEHPLYPHVFRPRASLSGDMVTCMNGSVLRNVY